VTHGIHREELMTIRKLLQRFRYTTENSNSVRRRRRLDGSGSVPEVLEKRILLAGFVLSSRIEFGPEVGGPETSKILTDQLQSYGIDFSTTNSVGVIWFGASSSSSYPYVIGKPLSSGASESLWPIDVDFAYPVSAASVRGFDGGGDTDTLTVSAFNGQEALVDSSTVTSEFIQPGETLSVSDNGIRAIRMDVSGTTSGLFFDDLMWTPQVNETIFQLGETTGVTGLLTQAQLFVQLDSEPQSDVVIDLIRSRPSETIVSQSSLTFTAANWSVPQTVTISAVDDTILDGDLTSTIRFSVNDARSDDSFDNLTDQFVTVVTHDNETDSLGDVDGDGDFDANDSFLIHLINLAGTDSQINQSKGGSSLPPTQIRLGTNQLQLFADVDGDSDFDANDSFLIHLVNLAGTDVQVDQSKGSSSLSASQIRQRVADLGSTDFNKPPIANHDSELGVQGGTVIIDVLENDDDADGTLVRGSVRVIDNANNGTATANADGTVSYTPANTFIGTDSFTYTVDDDDGETSNEATVTVNVEGNQPPVAIDDQVFAGAGTGQAINVLGNDTDLNGDETIVASSIVITVPPSNGTATPNSDGTITYVPKTSFTGSDQFSYTVSDTAGAVSIPAVVRISPVNIASVSPNDGDRAVKVDRPVTVRFSTAVDLSNAELAIDVFALGEELPGRMEISRTQEFVTFYPETPFPDQTRLRVRVNGDVLRDLNGNLVDINGDETFGGDASFEFTTHSLALWPDTVVTGKILQSNAYDSNGAPLELPIANATLRVEGTDIEVRTQEDGTFELKSLNGLPAPDFFVVIDGSTATGVPGGRMYPTLGKPFHSVRGQTTSLKDGQGNEMTIFLPLMEVGDIVDFNPEADPDDPANRVHIGFGEGGLETLASFMTDVDEDAWRRTRVSFAPGSPQDNAGNPANQAAIVPVDPNRLPGTLPPFLSPSLVISIQAGRDGRFNDAGGATIFDTPAQVEFPNLEGLKAGEQSLIWSFDHDAGEWGVVGTGTVSQDEKTIVSDGGVIQAPGWHAAFPGSPSTGARPQGPILDPDWIEILDTLEDLYDKAKGTGEAPLAHQILCLARTSSRSTWGQGWIKDLIADFTANRAFEAGLVDDESGAINPEPFNPFGFNWACSLLPPDVGSPQGITSGDLCASLTGFFHFIDDLTPGFYKYAEFTDLDQDGSGEKDHDEFFTQAVGPCFDEVFAAGEISAAGRDIAKAFVPIVAATLREATQAANEVVKTGNGVVDVVGPKAAELFSPILDSLSSFEITNANGGRDVTAGETLELSVRPKGNQQARQQTLNNYSMTILDSDFRAEVNSDGGINIIGSRKALTAMPSPLYVVVEADGEVGIGQFFIQDVDLDQDSIADSYEKLIGLDSTVANLGTDHDNDGLTDLEESVYRTDPTQFDSDGDNVGDSNEFESPINLRLADAAFDDLIGEVYFSVSNVETNEVFARGATPDIEALDLVLPPDTVLTLSAYHPDANAVASTRFTSNTSGSSTILPTLVMVEDSGLDSDGDGVSDDVEVKILGSDPQNPDDSQPLPIGALGEVGVENGFVATEVATTVAYAISQGTLHIIDVADFTSPVNLGIEDLSARAIGLAISEELTMAVVATASGSGSSYTASVDLIDVSDPLNPTKRGVPIDIVATGAIEVFGDLAFVATTTGLQSIDLVSGDLLDKLVLPGSGLIAELDRIENRIYAIQGGSDVVSIAQFQSDGSMSLVAQRSESIADTDISIAVNHDAVWLIGSGFRTRGVNDLTELGNPANASEFYNIGGLALAGSDRAVTFQNGNTLFPFDVGNTEAPSAAANFGAGIPLSGSIRDVEISNGLAYVATSSGLEIVNYRAFDSDDVPPTGLSITTTLEDADSTTAGFQVVEGESIPLFVNAIDDTQIRHVDLVANGEVIATDSSFPFDFVPAIPSPLSNEWVLRARATDTGGNSSLSEEFRVSVVPDTFAPTVRTVTPATGAIRYPNQQTENAGVQIVSLEFSEKLNESSFDVNHFQLTPVGGGSSIAPDSVTPRLANRAVDLAFSQLAEGTYDFNLDALSLSDRAGNSLDPTESATRIEIRNPIDPDPKESFIEATDLGTLNSSISYVDFYDEEQKWDTFKFTLTEPGFVSFEFADRPGGSSFSHRLLRLEPDDPSGNNPVVLGLENRSVPLLAGTYFIQARQTSAIGGGPYTFKLQVDGLVNLLPEDPAPSQPLSGNALDLSNYHDLGQIDSEFSVSDMVMAGVDDADVYRFELTSSQTVDITVSLQNAAGSGNGSGRVRLVRDLDGQEDIDDHVDEIFTLSNLNNQSFKETLTAGSYYLVVEPRSLANTGPTTAYNIKANLAEFIESPTDLGTISEETTAQGILVHVSQEEAIHTFMAAASKDFVFKLEPSIHGKSELLRYSLFEDNGDGLFDRGADIELLRQEKDQQRIALETGKRYFVVLEFQSSSNRDGESRGYLLTISPQN